MMALIILVLLGALLVFLALFGLRRTVLGLVVARPACDKAFEWVKQMAGGANGPGAALNILVLVMATVAIIQRPRVLLNPLAMAWCLVLGAALTSLLLSPDPAAGIRLLMTLVTYAAMTILPFALVRSLDDAASYLSAIIASSIVPASWAIVELVANPAILMGDDRLESTFTHSNILAFYLMGVMTLIMFMQSSRVIVITPRLRKFLLAYGGLLMLLLLATKTRSAWIATALILGGYALLVDRRWLLGLLALPLVLLIPGIGERVLDLGGGNVNDAYANLNSYAWRQLLWSETWQWLKDNPSVIYGHGLDMFVPHVPLFFSRGAEPAGIGAHNAILQIYFETGLVGIIAFALLFTAVFHALCNHMLRDFAGGLLLVLLSIAHMLVSYSDNLLDYLKFQWLFWFAIGTVAASTPFLKPAAKSSFRHSSTPQGRTLTA
ncbi:MAG: O-antigen ligase family protein [Beijerinckiaceae bacterium]